MSRFDYWMRFNVGDYLADTMELTTFQHGIYIRLIFHYFKRGSLPAPDDEAGLARVAGIPTPTWRRQAGPVIAMFKLINGAYRHTRVDAERERNRGVAEAKRRGPAARARKAREAAENSQSLDAYADENGAYAGLAPGSARAVPEPEQDSPPVSPPNGGQRGRGNSRNGFADSLSDDLQEAIDDARETDARQRGAEVVFIPRRAYRR